MERIGQRDIYNRGGITRWYWDLRDRAVLRHTADADSILDIGCGEAITLERIIEQRRQRTILGIDPDPRNVAVCRSLPVIQGNVYDLPQVPWKCCLLLDVLEHLSEPARALHKIYDVLAPGGKLILMFPNDELWFFARLACLKFTEAFADHGHRFQFYPDVMTEAMKCLGFRVQSVESVPWKCFPLHYLIVARKT